MDAAQERVSADLANVVGARPYGNSGQMPVDARVAVYSVHGVKGAVPHVSDAPYHVPYNERSTCIGTRSNGKSCGAKASEGGLYCEAHEDQG